jgi:hypothetical protein
MMDSFDRRHRSQLRPGKQKSALKDIPMFMQQTFYNESDEMRKKPQTRFLTPCNRLVKRDLQKTYHSPYDKDGKVQLNSFLGIDYRGIKAYNKLRKNVIK